MILSRADLRQASVIHAEAPIWALQRLAACVDLHSQFWAHGLCGLRNSDRSGSAARRVLKHDYATSLLEKERPQRLVEGALLFRAGTTSLERR